MKKNWLYIREREWGINLLINIRKTYFKKRSNLFFFKYVFIQFNFPTKFIIQQETKQKNIISYFKKNKFKLSTLLFMLILNNVKNHMKKERNNTYSMHDSIPNIYLIPGTFISFHNRNIKAKWMTLKGILKLSSIDHIIVFWYNIVP